MCLRELVAQPTLGRRSQNGFSISRWINIQRQRIAVCVAYQAMRRVQTVEEQVRVPEVPRATVFLVFGRPSVDAALRLPCCAALGCERAGWYSALARIRLLRPRSSAADLVSRYTYSIALVGRSVTAFRHC